MLIHLVPRLEQSWTLAGAVRPGSSPPNGATWPILEILDRLGRGPRWTARHVSNWRSHGAGRRHGSHVGIQRNALLMGCFRSHGDATTSVTPRLTGRRWSFS